MLAGANVVLDDELAAAISYSIKTPGKALHEKLKKKDPEFGYLRVVLGPELGDGPGVPYVLEIWPGGWGVRVQQPFASWCRSPRNRPCRHSAGWRMPGGRQSFCPPIRLPACRPAFLLHPLAQLRCFTLPHPSCLSTHLPARLPPSACFPLR